MSRCHHECSGITEFGTSSTFHAIESGEVAWHNSEFGDYTGEREAVCGKCGKRVAYRNGRLPKWVQAADAVLNRDIEQIGEAK